MYLLKQLILIIVTYSIFLLPSSSQVSAQEACTTPTSTPDTESISLGTNISTEGTYRIWTRMLTSQNDISKSFQLQINNECIQIIGGSSSIPPNTWTWVDYKNGDINNKNDVNLTAGNHTLKITPNESDISIDKIIITSDLSCTPIDFGNNCIQEPTGPISVSPLAGDYDKNGKVDLLDFNIWRNEFLNLFSSKLSDFNNDNLIDLLDFNNWLNAFKSS